jgi:hypothetical protein
MRIYPDPELPDVLVQWVPDLDCKDDGDRVVVSLSTIEPDAEAGRIEVPCRDGSARFDDVARVEYHVAAHVEDAAGEVLGGSSVDIDLRDGLSERVDAFFGRYRSSNFRVRWTFAVGASCESLGVRFVQLAAFPAEQDQLFSSWSVPCRAPVFVNAIPPPGMYTLSAVAVAASGVVATAPPSAPFEIVRDQITDVGTLVLSPCGGECPGLARRR